MRQLRIFAVSLVALMMLAGPALAVSPSPRLLARAKKDPALARRIEGLQARMRARGIDAPRHVRAPGRSVGAPLAAGSSWASPNLAAPVSGPTKMLVLLVDFSDQVATTPATFFDDLVFKDTTGPASVRGYYRELSFGKVDIVTENTPSAIGWLRMPQPLSYYANNAYGTDGPYPNNAQRMVEDAVGAADATGSGGVDFSSYDGNGDGYVDTLVVIHAGRGAEFTGSPGDIWSHAWETATWPIVDGVRVREYSTDPEYWVTPGDMTTGVYVHELGHTFGLPDLYDTTYNSYGLGRWSLMAGGSWNGPDVPGVGSLGGSPARFDAWSLTKLGFSQAVSITSSVTSASIPAVDSTSTGGVFRLDPDQVAGGAEYFLVENRRKRGTDSYARGDGLLVWHVDETRANNDDPTHYLVDLEEAHGGAQHLTQKPPYQGNSGDAEDPFPGTAGLRRTLDDFSDPNQRTYPGPYSRVRVADVSPSATTMTASLGYSPPMPDFAPLLSSAATSALPGQAVAIRRRLWNYGTAPTPASTLKYFLSTDANLDASDVVLADVPVAAIAAWTSVVDTVTLPMPTGLSAGLVYIIAAADPDGAIAEYSETNNRAALSIVVRERMPDLVCFVTSSPRTGYPGARVTVGWRVLNQGDAAAGPSRLRVVFSPNGVLDASDPVLATVDVGVLAAGAESSGATAVTVPTSAPVSQTSQIFVVADALGAVAESDENNDAALAPVWIDPLKTTRLARPKVRSVVSRARPVTVTSKLTGAPTRATVVLQVYNRGWRKRATVRSGSRGAVSARIRFVRSDRGRRKIRFLYAGGSGYAGCSSPVVTIRVL